MISRHDLFTLKHFTKLALIFSQVTCDTKIQETEENVQNNDAEREEAEKETKAEAARILTLKRQFHKPADRASFGKASPLCQRVLRKSVEEAKVCCDA